MKTSLRPSIKRLASRGRAILRATIVCAPLALPIAVAVTSSALTSRTLVAADDKDGPTFIDPAQPGEEYAWQGEFSGSLTVGENRTWGAQVIALGKGKYRLVGYPGGLPGDGYNAGDERKKVEGSRTGDKVVFEADGFSAEVQADKLTILAGSEVIGTLNRVKRESSTLGKKPAEGAIVLFDGASAGKFERGKMTEEKLLMADTASMEKFGDHSMHIEFRLPFRPEARGQARGNSGVYVQSRYEIQVLDSFGLEGEDNECGGIYKNARPKVNMCYPPLVWQTYDIDFTAARYDDQGKKSANAKLTVRHNGVIIHDNLELTSGTPGRLPEGPGDQPLYLQGHGNPVVYRNIWAVKR